MPYSLGEVRNGGTRRSSCALVFTHARWHQSHNDLTPLPEKRHNCAIASKNARKRAFHRAQRDAFNDARQH